LYLHTYLITGENMTNDEIINLAIENTIHGLKFNEEGLLRFAKLVAQHEREACAKVCDDLWQDDKTAFDCREAIRARGQA
jgi:hypothetical protein